MGLLLFIFRRDLSTIQMRIVWFDLLLISLFAICVFALVCFLKFVFANSILVFVFLICFISKQIKIKFFLNQNQICFCDLDLYF